MRPKTLDHVALWTSARDETAAALVPAGLRVIHRTDTFTLLGADARRGKLTLFDAEGPREPGPLVHIAFGLPGGSGALDLPDGLRVLFVEGDGDLDHVALRSAAPEETAAEYERYGFRRAGPASVEVGGSQVRLEQGDVAPSDRPLLNHLGLLVDSVDEHVEAAERLGLEDTEYVDAPNTRALFVPGPEGVRIEYVEHKPTFSLV